MKLLTGYKFFLIIIFFLALMNGCTKKEYRNIRKEIIFLELNTDLSLASEYSRHFQYGVKLALQEVNKLGGIKGKKVIVFHRNDYLNALEAKRAILDYKNTNILAAFGTFFSPATEGAALGAAKAKIPFLSCGYSDSIIYSNPDKYTYRLRPGLYSNLKAIALEASRIGNLNRWLIITYSSEEGQKAAKFFEKEIISLFKHKENKIINKNESKTNEEIGYTFNYMYVSPFKIKGFLDFDNLSRVISNVKAVLIITNGKDLQYFLDTSNIKEQLVNKAVFIPFAGDPEWLNYTNKASNPKNWLVTGYPWYSLNSINHKTFYNSYYNSYRIQPRYASIIGYLSVHMLIATAKQLDLNNPNIFQLREEFADKLSETVLNNTPLGKIAMRKDHISTLGVYTGYLNTFSQDIIANNGIPMVLKDLHMEDITYYDDTLINISEINGLKIRKNNQKKRKKN